MLAARASTRNASRIVRNFATVVESAGVKVAALDHGQPTAAVTFLVKAGSRFETKPGVAHALKNFAFKVRRDAFLFQNMSIDIDFVRVRRRVRRWELFERVNSTAECCPQV